MKTDEQLRQLHDEAVTELAGLDATISRALEARAIARTVPAGVGDTNLQHLRDRRLVLAKRIRQLTRNGT